MLKGGYKLYMQYIDLLKQKDLYNMFTFIVM